MKKQELRKYQGVWGQGLKNQKASKKNKSLKLFFQQKFKTLKKRFPLKKMIFLLLVPSLLIYAGIEYVMGPPLPSMPSEIEYTNGAIRLNRIIESIDEQEHTVQQLDELSKLIRLEGTNVLAETLRENAYIYDRDKSFKKLLYVADLLNKHGSSFFEDGDYETSVLHKLATAKLYQTIAAGVGKPAAISEGALAYTGEIRALNDAASYLKDSGQSPEFLGRITEDFSGLEITRPLPLRLLNGERYLGLERAINLRKNSPWLWALARVTGEDYIVRHNKYLQQLEKAIAMDHKEVMAITELDLWINSGLSGLKILEESRIQSLNFINSYRKALALSRACAIMTALRADAWKNGSFPEELPDFLQLIEDPYTEGPFQWRGGKLSGTLASPGIDMISTPGGGDDMEWFLSMPSS